jgi:hypothetical protein
MAIEPVEGHEELLRELFAREVTGRAGAGHDGALLDGSKLYGTELINTELDESRLDDAERDDAERDGAGLDDARRALEALDVALAEDPPIDAAALGLPPGLEVRGVLGRGASGVVLCAHQASLGRDVAVKVLAAPGEPREAERLIAEARRLATLAHPGIVQVHEVGRVPGGVYIVLELVPGGSLQTLLAGGPLGAARAASLVRQVAEALAHSHERGVVHLDLKPGNVLLDAVGRAKVADFGLARELAAGHQAGQLGGASSRGLVGTPEYMAPEQANGARERLDERTDVHGLGALLYACLAGQPPFQARSLAETLDAVRHAEPQRLERAAPGVPRDLAAIAAVALAKDPARRYPTARAVAQDLARFEAGEPVLARPPGALVRTAARLRRHRREALAALAAAVATGASLLPFAPEPKGDGRWIDAAERALARGELHAAREITAELRRSALGDEGEERRVSALEREVERALAVASGAASGAAARGTAAPETAAPAAAASDVGSHDVAASDATLRGAIASDAVAPAPGVAGQTEPSGSAPVAAASDGLCTVLVDTWLLMDDRSAQRLWSGTATGPVGERLRLEGAGRVRLRLPHAKSGIDAFAIAPASGRGRPSNAARVEVEGLLEARGEDVQWRLVDNEVWLSLSGTARSTFVRFNADGPFAAGPALVEAQRYVFGIGRGCVMLKLAELARGEADLAAAAQRDLAGWAKALAGAVDAGAGHLDELAAAEPQVRGAYVDQVIAAVLLRAFGSGGALARLEAELATRGIEPWTLSDGLTPRGRFADTTRTGADLGEWLALAATDAGGAAGATIDALPESSSMRSLPATRPRGLQWLWLAYVAIACASVGIALARGARTEARLPGLGSAFVLAAVSFDKRVTSPFGVLSLDPLAACALAGAMFALRRAAPRFAPWAATAFLVAALQSLAVARLGVPDLRVPLVLGFLASAGAGRELATNAWARGIGTAAAMVLALAYVVGLAAPAILSLAYSVGLAPTIGAGTKSVALYFAYGAQLTIAVLVALAASVKSARALAGS